MITLCFLSGHGGGTKEIAQVCKATGVRLVLPGQETQKQLRHLASEKEAKKLGLECWPTMERLKQAYETGEVDAWIVSRPEAIKGIHEFLGKKIPIIARHGVNSYERYQKLGLKNFITASRGAIKKLGAENNWLSVKVRDFEYYDTWRKKQVSTHKRSGYRSFVHHYKKYWPRAYSFFQEVVQKVGPGVEVENFGKDSENGVVNDHEYMVNSRAVLHIKDGQVCCNAPINAINLGVPVLMDHETLDILGLHDYIVHQVSGLLFDTPEECAEWIRVLETDDAFHKELSDRTFKFARLKCQYSNQDYVKFRHFLNRMK